MNRSVGAAVTMNMVETLAPVFRLNFVGLAVPPAPTNTAVASVALVSSPPPGAPALSLTPAAASQLKTEPAPLVGIGVRSRFTKKRFRSLAPFGPLKVTLTGFWAETVGATIAIAATAAATRSQLRIIGDSSGGGGHNGRRRQRRGVVPDQSSPELPAKITRRGRDFHE